jgi:hypothetical protein
METSVARAVTIYIAELADRQCLHHYGKRCYKKSTTPLSLDNRCSHVREYGENFACRLHTWPIVNMTGNRVPIVGARLCADNCMVTGIGCIELPWLVGRSFSKVHTLQKVASLVQVLLYTRSR